MAKKKLAKGIPIRPEELARQMRLLPHRFQVNLWNFEAQAGKAAEEVFKRSFALQRFNSGGSAPWRPRSDKKTHPILTETGTLRESITWKHLSNPMSPSGVSVYTDPNRFWTTKRNIGVCFAAVHNEKDGTYVYGKMGVPSIRRQFMGNSTVLTAKLKKLSEVIFTGFPK